MPPTDLDNTKYIDLRERLTNAHFGFQLAIDDYDGLPPEWQALQQRFGNVVKAARHAETCADELAPSDQQDLARFLGDTVEPFISYYRDVIENSDRSIDDIEEARIAYCGCRRCSYVCTCA